MKSISEPIARRANAEDKVNGRFWQGRFKSQLLRDERAVLKRPDSAKQPLLAMVGANSFNAPLLTNADYLERVDFTGRMIQSGRRGRIKEEEPRALTKFGLDPKHWTAKAKGKGNGLARGRRTGRFA